jgi:predicted ATPase
MDGVWIERMQAFNPPFYIFTGGPGVGKSTTLRALEKRGYTVYFEAARSLIRQANLGLHEAHPQKNLTLFRDKILKKDLEYYHQAIVKRDQLCFFDRGIIDLIAFDHLIHTPHAEQVKKLAHEVHYNHLIFFFPPWEEIFETDPERVHTFQEAKEIASLIQKIYPAYGYKLIEVPKDTVKNRCDWILNKIKIRPS